MVTEVKAGQLRRWSIQPPGEAYFALPEEKGYDAGDVFLVTCVAGAWSSLMLKTGLLRETTTLIVRKASKVIHEVD